MAEAGARRGCRGWIPAFLVVAILVACSAAVDVAEVDDVPEGEAVSEVSETDERSAPAESPVVTEPTASGDDGLAMRPGPRRETSGTVPHVQLDAVPIPAVDAELRRRAFSLPGVEDRPSVISLPGAVGFWLSEELDLARPDVLNTGREFAHVHADGSLHLWLPVDRAIEVHETQWGELHPWVERDNFWDGVVMVYTPESLSEVDVVTQLIIDAYNFVTGAELTLADVS